MNENYEELCKQIDILDDIIEEKTEKFDKFWFSEEEDAKRRKVNEYPSYSEFEKYYNLKKDACQPEWDQVKVLRNKQKRIMPVERLEDIPNYGDVMSLDTFIGCVKEGGFIDYDGFGNYIQDGKMTNIEIRPSDLKNNCIRKEFKEIIWFNR